MLIVGLILVVGLGFVLFLRHRKKAHAYRDAWHQGRPGTRWALMEKFVISRVPGDPYLTRWRLIHTPFFGILLHKIDGPDPDRDPHDHPWVFWSLVLKGGYVEIITTPSQTSMRWVSEQKCHHRFSLHKMQKGLYHKIVELENKPTWTLIFTGPRRSEWGFLTPDRGHVMWKTYLGLDS